MVIAKSRCNKLRKFSCGFAGKTDANIAKYKTLKPKNFRKHFLPSTCITIYRVSRLKNAKDYDILKVLES